MSFRLKTILGVAGIEAILLAILIFNVLHLLHESNEKQLIDRVSTTAKMFSTACRDAVIASDLATLESIANTVIDNPDVVYARVLDADNRVLAESGNPLILERQFKENFSSTDVTDSIFNTQSPVIEAGYQYGSVQLGFDILKLQKILQNARSQSITIAIIEMGLVALFSFFLGIYLTRQLSRLAKASDIVASGNLGYQVKVQGNDEIAKTIRAFNRMSLQLKQDVEKLEATHQELVKAKEEAEQANKAKSLFLSNMSHELRTPLNAIIGFSQLLEMELKDASQLESLQEISIAGEHLLNLVNEILDLAKIEVGKLTLSIEDVELDHMLDDCLRLITPMQTKQDIKVRITEKIDGIVLRGDHLRIKQVIINLLSNAIKYNKPAGEVSIVISKPVPDTCRIQISDTGVGIPEDKLKELFKPFNRLNSTDSAIEGTGIGLVITKDLVELMQGKIGVVSQPGQGSDFWIELPVSQQAVTANTTAIEKIDDLITQPANEIGKKGTILYIEDNPANLRLVIQSLKRKPELVLHTASEASKGIELCKTVKPDLVLLDINLPDMNGFAVLKTLRENCQFHHTPIIAVSANAMKSDIEKGQQAGFDQYLTKPININELYAVIDSYLEN